MRAIEGITGKEIITFGLGEENDYYATNIKKIQVCRHHIPL